MTENDRENDINVDYSVYVYKKDSGIGEQEAEDVEFEVVEEFGGNVATEDNAANDISLVSDRDESSGGRSAVDIVAAKIASLDLSKESECVKSTKAKKTVLGRKRRFLLISTVIVMCFVFVILIADILSDGYIAGKVAGIFSGKGESRTYYAVELASYTDMNSARLMSQEVRAGGAGGYVVNDELYRVIAEVYPTRNEALSVSAKLNLDGYVTAIYEIGIPEIKYSVFPMSTRNITRDVMDYADDIFTEFYRIAADIDGGKLDYARATSEVTAVIDRIKGVLVDYESNCDNEIDNDKIVTVRAQLNAVIGAMSNIITESNGLSDMVSDIRYVNAMILNTHRALCRSFADSALV